MAEVNNAVDTEVKATDGGRILFADDVIATIASLAVADVKGVCGMSGSVAEGFSSILSKKHNTKGVKVQVGTEEASVDLSVLIQYGHKIQEVCQNIQVAVKNAIETMTGLSCNEVNVFVAAVCFDAPEKKKAKAEEAPVEAEVVEAEVVPAEE